MNIKIFIHDIFQTFSEDLTNSFKMNSDKTLHFVNDGKPFLGWRRLFQIFTRIKNIFFAFSYYFENKLNLQNANSVNWRFPSVNNKLMLTVKIPLMN